MAAPNGRGPASTGRPEEEAAVLQEPQNLVAEEFVLGALMFGGATVIERVRATGLDVSDFYRETHRLIYRACLDLHDEGSPVDPVIVSDRLHDSADLAQVGGADRVAEIATLTPVAGNAPHHALIVMKEAQRRRAVRLLDDARPHALNGGVPAELRDELVAVLDGSTDAKRSRRLRTVRGDEIEMKSIHWLEEPFLQGAAFQLLAGPKGVGKGTWLARTASLMTHGVYHREPRSVLILSSEDSASIDTLPRLAAAGADLTRVHVLHDEFLLPRDLRLLEDRVREIGDVGLVTIDPLSNYIGGVDTDKEGAVRFAIGGLNRFADELSCLTLGVRHFGKQRENGALSAVLGSTAWVDLPRAVLAFAPDDEDEAVFHVQVVAGNRSGRSQAHAFRIGLKDVGLDHPVTRAIALGESLKNVDDLLSQPRRTSKSASAREVILDILDSDGEQGSDALDARVASETGLTAKTIKNLRAELSKEGLIRAMPVKDEFGAVGSWKVTRTLAPRPEKGSDSWG